MLRRGASNTSLFDLTIIIIPRTWQHTSRKNSTRNTIPHGKSISWSQDLLPWNYWVESRLYIVSLV